MRDHTTRNTDKQRGETVEMNTHDDTRGGKSNVMHTGQTITTKPESTTHKPDIDITQDKIQRGKY